MSAALRWATAALLVALVAPAPVSAWCRMTTSLRRPTIEEPCVLPRSDTTPPEQYLTWLRPCSTMALSVSALSDDLDEAEVRGVLSRSIASWEAVQCAGTPVGIDIEILDESSTCTAPLYRDDGGNVNSLMFVSDWADREYDAAAFAVTTVWHRRSTGEILDVDMEINERRGPYGICPEGGCIDMRVVDLENVVTHELGHYLGLAHSAETDATMFASALAGETTKRDLTADDIEGLCAIYPPGLPAAECDYTPRGGLVTDCNTGCSVVHGVGTGPGSAPLLAVIAALALVARRRRR